MLLSFVERVDLLRPDRAVYLSVKKIRK